MQPEKITANWFNIKFNTNATIKIEYKSVEEQSRDEVREYVESLRKSHANNIIFSFNKKVFILGKHNIPNACIETATYKTHKLLITSIVRNVLLNQFFSSQDFKVFKKKVTWVVLDKRNPLFKNKFPYLDIHRKYNLHFSNLYLKGENHLGVSITTSLNQRVNWKEKDFIKKNIKCSDLEFYDDGICKTNISSIQRILNHFSTQSELKKEIERLETNENQYDLCLKFVEEFFVKKINTLKLPLGLDIFSFKSLELPYNTIRAGALFNTLSTPKRYFYNDKTPPDIALDSLMRSKIVYNKPFSYDFFENKEIKIAVIYPKKYHNEIAIFCNYILQELADVYKIKKSQINFEKFEIEDFELSSYQVAVPRINNIDLVLVLVSESQINLSPDLSPYYFCKHQFLSKTVNSQEIQIQQIESFLVNKEKSTTDYKDHTIALNIYAKLGGTAWTIRKQSDDMTNGLVFGIGGTTDKNKQPVIGLTSIFRSDGKYILGETKSVTGIDEYKNQLTSVVKKSLSKSLQEGFIDANKRVLLYFHIYKSVGRENEIQALLLALKEEEFKQLDIVYTFVHIGYGHNYCFHLSKNEEYINKHKRGSFIKINDSLGFISLKSTSPSYLKIDIDSRSTEKNLSTIANQIFSFSEISHTSFKDQSMPVTIKYPQLMARMATKMKSIPGFYLKTINMPDDSLWFI